MPRRQDPLEALESDSGVHAAAEPSRRGDHQQSGSRVGNPVVRQATLPLSSGALFERLGSIRKAA
jgi:hypothetical protein